MRSGAVALVFQDKTRASAEAPEILTTPHTSTIKLPNLYLTGCNARTYPKGRVVHGWGILSIEACLCPGTAVNTSENQAASETLSFDSRRTSRSATRSRTIPPRPTQCSQRTWEDGSIGRFECSLSPTPSCRVRTLEAGTESAALMLIACRACAV